MKKSNFCVEWGIKVALQDTTKVIMDPANRVESIIERFVPEAVSLVFGALTYTILHHGWYELNADTKLTELFGAVVNVCAIAVGFLGTVAAVLISLDGRKAIEAIKAVDLYGSLFGYIIKAVVWSFACAVITTILILYQTLKIPSFFHFFVLSAWTFLAFASCCSSLLVVIIFSLILRKISRENALH